MEKQKIYKVKLSFPFDWPIMRQTKNWSGQWENYKFVLNDAINECDFWVIFSKYNLKKEVCHCPPENVIFLPCEPFSVEQFNEKFLKQFALIITCQRQINYKSVAYDLGGHPWFVEKSYDELVGMQSIQKTKKMSIITSNKIQTEGHRKRLEFAYRLKDYFKEEIDLFGRGINDFDDKWHVLAPYKYSVIIENDFVDDYLTEKFFDCHLAFTYPLYYGCPNAEKYFSQSSFSRINIDDFECSVKIIENILLDDSHYENHLQNIKSERLKILNEYNLFPLLVSYMNKLDGSAQRKSINISPRLSMKNYFNYFKRIFK